MMINKFIIFIFICLLSFLVGAIPSGYLFAKWYGISDVRTIGSGNIGASNVGRALGWKAFIMVFLLDALKAIIVLLWAQLFVSSFILLVIIAFGVLIGNCFSPFLQFNGGKGVATLMGIIGVFSPLVMCCAVVIWLIAVALTKVPAIASLCTLCTLPFLSYCFISISFIPFLLAASFIVLWRHKQNFKLLKLHYFF
ncbi:glycerol-3-phosphate acyltransferase [Candidatus Dependentiae bacterium]|nr:MAG: glycerol-3-phosphate acyltransferase [Candidatus Dependentiae bacterium]